MLILFGN